MWHVHSCLKPLTKERKSMSRSWSSHAVWTWILTWKCLELALIWMNEVIWASISTQIDNFHQYFCLWRHWTRYDVVMTTWHLKGCTLKPLNCIFTAQKKSLWAKKSMCKTAFTRFNRMYVIKRIYREFEGPGIEKIRPEVYRSASWGLPSDDKWWCRAWSSWVEPVLSRG